MKAEDFIVSKRNRVLDSSQCTARVAFSPSRIRARQALFSDWGDRALLRSGIMRPWLLFSPHLAKMAESGDGMLVHYRSVATATVTSDAKIMVPRGVDLDVGRGEVDVGRAVAQREEDPPISFIGGILDRDGGECLVLGGDLQHMDTSQRARFRGVSIGFDGQRGSRCRRMTLAFFTPHHLAQAVR